MNSIIKQYCSLERLSGVITWAIVAGMSLFVIVDNEFAGSRIALAVFLYFLYIILWLNLLKEEQYGRKISSKIALLIILFFIVIGIYFTTPSSFNAILMGIIGGALPHFLRVNHALMIASLAAIPLYIVYSFYWNNQYMFLSAALFWTFNIFTVIMVNSTVTAKRAKEELEATNLELTSTQSLLEEASKQNERIRIARNIHDLLGHHLTALSINLQVASLKTDGEVKENIDQCYHLAKLLLSDVREAVSDIRDKSHIDLQTAMNSISKQVPELSIDIDYEGALKIDNIQVADTLLKCIQESVTNTIKHNVGRKMSLLLSQDQNNIRLRIKSHGNMPTTLKPGNGINGMKERIALLKGTVAFHLSKEMLITDVNLPLNMDGQI